MRTLVILTTLVGVLSSTSLYHSEPRSVPCDDLGKGTTQAAVHLINDLHRHGYKYRLSKTRSTSLVKKDNSICEFHLELDLEETKCHVVNPKPFDKCEVRNSEETKVKADCNVTLTVTKTTSEIKKFSCNSEAASAEDLVAMCPDCPTLLNLHDSQGLNSVKRALKKFHSESKDTSLFKLMEVGRLSTQSMILGQTFFAEFVIVETNCSRGAEPESVETCQPLCDSNTRHGFCSSILLGNDDVSVSCEIYDAKNVTDEGPKEKGCGYPDRHWHPHSLARSSFPHCSGQLEITSTIHPICPPPPFHDHPPRPQGASGPAMPLEGP